VLNRQSSRCKLCNTPVIYLCAGERLIIVGEREGSFYEAVKKSGWSGVVDGGKWKHKVKC